MSPIKISDQPPTQEGLALAAAVKPIKNSVRPCPIFAFPSPTSTDTPLSMLWPFAQTEAEELVIKTVRVLACELTQQVRAHWALPPTGRAQPTPPR
jgi:hypothetical protein